MITGTNSPQLTAVNRITVFPENLQHQVDKFAPKDVLCKIKVERDLYFGNDSVNGSVMFTAMKALQMKAVRVAIVCRMRWRYGDTFSICTVYTEKKVIAQNLEVEKGVNVVPFTFTLPLELPSSLEHKLINVAWDIRLLSREDFDCMDTMAYTRFQVSSLYHSNYYSPRSQGEVNTIAKNTMAFRAEANLQQDVHNDGNPVHCNIKLLKMHEDTKMRRIEATLKQHVTSQFKSMKLKCTATIDSASINYRTQVLKWEPTMSNSNAVSVDLSLGLLANVPKRTMSRLALQKHTGGRSHLTPSTCVSATAHSPSLSITYSVEVSIETNTCVDLVLSVPFTLQGSTANAPLPTEALIECKTFAKPDNDPPTYEDYVWKSRSTFCPISLHNSSGSEMEITDSDSSVTIPGIPYLVNRLRSYNRSRASNRKGRRAVRCHSVNSAAAASLLVNSYKPQVNETC